MEQEQILWKSFLVWLTIVAILRIVVVVNFKFFNSWSWRGFKEFSTTYAIYYCVAAWGAMIFGIIGAIYFIRYLFFLY